MNLRECVPLYQKHLSKSVHWVALFTRSKSCFGAVLYCSPNKVNHFTTTLYPRDLLNIPPKLWSVRFYYSLCLKLLWLQNRFQFSCDWTLDCDNVSAWWNCVLSCLFDCNRMYQLNVKHPWAEQRCIVFVPLAYLSKCPISPRSEFAGKQRMRDAQVTWFWPPPPLPRWKWDTLQSESLREFLWPAISGTGDKMKLRHPTYLCCHRARKNLCCQEQKHQKISCQLNPPSFSLQWWLMLAPGIFFSKMIEFIIMIENCKLRVGNSLTMMMKSWRQCQRLQLITFRVIRMGMIYIFVQIGRALNRPAAGSPTNWEKNNVVKI